MTGRRAAVQTLLLVIAALALPAAAPGSDERVKLDALPIERIVLETRASGPHDYRAWRADTPETRSRGLMYVAALDEDQAMIFIYDEPQIVSMWMKNTYLPLDMLFVDARGCIVKIAERTKPLSLASIESGKPVVLVIEIRGGGTAAVGARIGDRLRRPDASWPAAAPGGC